MAITIKGKTSIKNKGIVTDGLVFYVDAANENSYPGSGTTWTDLIDKKEGTLEPTNGPTYDSGDGGSIVFDGADDMVDFGGGVLNLGTQDMTISSWVKLTSNPSGYVTVVCKAYASSGNRYFMGANSSREVTSLLAGSSVKISEGSTALSLDTWHFITGVWDRSGNVSIYVDGTADTVSNADISALDGENISHSSIRFRIGSYAANNKVSPLLLWPGNIATTMLYFRTLSSTEILQNYNALKNRFI